MLAAAARKDWAVVKRMLSDERFDVPLPFMMQLISIPASTGQLAALRMILGHPEVDGWMKGYELTQLAAHAVVLAAGAGHAHIVDDLLPDKRYSMLTHTSICDVELAVRTALKGGHEAIAKRIVTDPAASVRFAECAFDAAASVGNLPFLDWLLSPAVPAFAALWRDGPGANAKRAQQLLTDAAQRASSNGHIAMLQRLLDGIEGSRAAVDATDDRSTMYFGAGMGGHADILALLLAAADAQLRARGRSGKPAAAKVRRRALYGAAGEDRRAIVAQLLADPKTGGMLWSPKSWRTPSPPGSRRRRSCCWPTLASTRVHRRPRPGAASRWSCTATSRPSSMQSRRARASAPPSRCCWAIREWIRCQASSGPWRCGATTRRASLLAIRVWTAPLLWRAQWRRWQSVRPAAAKRPSPESCAAG